MGSAPHHGVGDVGVIVLVSFAQGKALRAAAWLALGRWPMMRTPGLSFFKVLGAGRDAGFGIVPGLARQGIFCSFRSEAAADDFLSGSWVIRFLRSNAHEIFSAKLRAISSRGAWSGMVPLSVTASASAAAPVASLTRASIRPSKAVAFWRHARPVEGQHQSANGCMVAAGLGEMPLLRQATFTIWESADAMDAFAHRREHLDAIRATRAGGYFSEELFARFVPYEMRGAWKGRRFEGPTSMD